VSKALSTLGFVAVLRRLAAGPYMADMMLTIEDLIALKGQEESTPETDYSSMDERLFPTYTALESVPIIQVTLAQAKELQFGRAITAPDTGERPLPQVQLRLKQDQLDLLLGIGELDAQGVIAPKRLLKVPELDVLLANNQ
jgi:tRNA pseudouridine55 synthase